MATETSKAAVPAEQPERERHCLLVVRRHAGGAVLQRVRQGAAAAAGRLLFVFWFEHKLNLDTARLEKDFYELSRKLHPDVYAQAHNREQQWSLEQTSRLNDAYRTLKDPIKRTEYLLHLEGVQLEEQSKAATEAARASGEMKKQVIPPALLEEIFELNMQLEEARMNRKMGERDAELEKALLQQKANLEHQFQALSQELHGDWHEWDKLMDREQAGHAIPQEERTRVRDKMVDLLNRRNYIRNLVRDVNEVLEN